MTPSTDNGGTPYELRLFQCIECDGEHAFAVVWPMPADADYDAHPDELDFCPWCDRRFSFSGGSVIATVTSPWGNTRTVEELLTPFVEA